MPSILYHNACNKKNNIITLIWCCVFMLGGGSVTFAQKYNFINQNVENGLVQSQVVAFAQNPNNELYIGTLGGVSVFDGTNFVNYTTSNGLLHNIVTSIARDKAGLMWIATTNGVSSYDGKTMRKYPLPQSTDNNTRLQINADAKGRVWLINNINLYCFNGNEFVKDNRIDSVTGFTVDAQQNIWAIVYRKGIYKLESDQWRLVYNLHNDASIQMLDPIFGKYSNWMYCRTNKGLMVFNGEKLFQPDFIVQDASKRFPSRIMEDSKHNVWLAYNDGGAWRYDQKQWLHFTYNNGLTDDVIQTFYEDDEGNIWIGSNGSGFFRYSGSVFTYYDRSSGLSGSSTMSIAEKDNKIYIANNNAGVYALKNNTPQRVFNTAKDFNVNTLLYKKDKLYLGSNQGLFMSTNDHELLRVPFQKETPLFFNVTHLHQQEDVVWISSQLGLYKMSNGIIQAQQLSKNIPVLTTQSVNKDSLLIGTTKGVYWYNTTTQTLQESPLLSGSANLCFAADAQNVYIGTDDKGVVIWNKKTRQFSNINHNLGLTCDYVYSLLVDKNGKLWVGTGCGIDRVTISATGSILIKSFGKSDGLLGVENNANASFEDEQGFLWFGTTKGVFCYNPHIQTSKSNAPIMVLQSVKLFNKELFLINESDSILPNSAIPYDPQLPTHQNNLSFTFKGIYLSNPDKVRYRYQLLGADKNYTETNQNTVVYPNLPPGEYVFKVWASDADGNWYDNALVYPFVIKEPFYGTWYFKVLVSLSFAALVIGIAYWRNRQKALRRKWKEQLREEEQAIVRQKTAEDFHDEIGNKLTRINLLVTLAERKLPLNETGSVQNILHQISDNVSSLYQGSQDIIWSLQPDSDYLNEIIFRIHQNNIELLENATIEYHYQGLDDHFTHVKMPIDYSRNLIMIFKEAVNNVVKHAQATAVHFEIDIQEQHIIFTLRDNGKGYDPDAGCNGNGLRNIKNRAHRIHADIKVTSVLGKGSMLQLSIKI
jgi:ligand-binding sensor domain-containing protein/signal transduction histidine kinase